MKNLAASVFVSLFWVRAVSGDALSAWTWANPRPQGNNLNDVVRGADKFVAVGELGTVLTSTDVTKWDPQQLPSTPFLRAVAFGGGRYVAVGEETWTSADGVEWTKAQVSPFRDVLHDGSRFLAVTSEGDILSSPDGQGWAIEGDSFLRGDTKIAFGNGTYVVASWNAAGAEIISLRLPGPSTGTYLPPYRMDRVRVDSVMFADGEFFVLGANALPASPDEIKPFLLRSVDGRIWTRLDLNLPVAPLSLALLGGNWYLGTSGGLYTSTNLTDWSFSGATNEYLCAVHSAGDVLVAVGGGGEILRATLSESVASQRTGTVQPLFEAAHGNGLIIAVGGFGRPILLSRDGTSWNEQTVPGSFSGITFGGGRFIATGSTDGTEAFFSSEDGLNWTTFRLPYYTSIGGVVYTGNSYFAVEAGGGGPIGACWTSSDAESWRMVKGFSTAASSIAYGNGLLVVGGSDGSIMTSSDSGVTWQSRTSGTTATIHQMVFLNNIFVGADSDGQFLYSTNGETWNISTTKALSVNSITYGAGRFLAVGQARSMALSADGAAWTSLKGPIQQMNAVLSVENHFYLFGGWGHVLRSGYVGTPRLKAGLDAENTIRLTVDAEEGARVTVQVSDSLAEWRDWLTVTAEERNPLVIQEKTLDDPSRFYRVRSE